MTSRLIITALLFVLSVTVLMGVGALVIVLTPAFNDHAMRYFPPMVAISAVVALIGSFLYAPHLRAPNEAAN